MPVSDRKARISVRKSSSMTPTISTAEYKSSVHNHGRAISVTVVDIPPMSDDEWRERLREAVDASGRSMRNISLKAGLSEGYVHSILGEGNDAKIANLIKICDELGVSITQIMYGFEMTADAAEMLRVYANLSEGSKAAVLLLAKQAAASSTPPPQPPKPSKP